MRAVSTSVFTAPKQRQGFDRKPLNNTTPFVVDPFSFLKSKYFFSRFREQDSGVSYANINAQDPSRQLVERLLIHTLCCTLMHARENHVDLCSFQATETGCMVRLRDVRPMTFENITWLLLLGILNTTVINNGQTANPCDTS